MKVKEIKELKAKSKDELAQLLNEKRIQLLKTEFDVKMGKIKNSNIIKELKKDIARILTFMKQKSA